MRTIKKYANRKLYDTTDKQYISRERLSELIKEGEEVTIVDNQTGEDITSQVVSQLIGRESKDRGGVPTKVLFELLRKGGDTLGDFAQKSARFWHSAMDTMEDETEKLIKHLVKDKEISESQGRSLKNGIMEYTRSMRTWIQEKVDEKVDDAMAGMKLASAEKVHELSAQVAALQKRIEELEKSKTETQ